MPWARIFWAFSPFLNHLRNFLSESFLSENAIVASVAQHLFRIAFRVVQCHVGGLALLISYDRHAGVDKSLVRSQVKACVAIEHFLMERLLHLDAILLHQAACRLIVALTLDALDLCQFVGEDVAQRLIVVDFHDGLSCLLRQFHGGPGV